MTKYVLVGGWAWKAADGGKAFCEEVVSGLPRPASILICAFARPREGWEKALLDERALFDAHVPGAATFELADLNGFEGQLEGVDAVYFKGGGTQELKKALSAYPNLKESLSGKTVIGSSAGTDALTAWSYDIDHGHLDRGLGLVPVKTLVHYRSDYNAPNVDWDACEAAVEAAGEAEMPFYRIREGEFVVLSA